jgi:hypothetical protein
MHEHTAFLKETVTDLDATHQKTIGPASAIPMIVPALRLTSALPERAIEGDGKYRTKTGWRVRGFS